MDFQIKYPQLKNIRQIPSVKGSVVLLNEGKFTQLPQSLARSQAINLVKSDLCKVSELESSLLISQSSEKAFSLQLISRISFQLIFK